MAQERHTKSETIVVKAILGVLLIWFAPPWPCYAQPRLGDAPARPVSAAGLPKRGPKPMTVTGGFSVNTDDREDTREFYQAVYLFSEGVPINSTANVSSCAPGTNASLFQDAVLLRINWFRAMAGVPANVTFDPGDCANDQLAAVMMSANDALSHDPPANWVCYSPGGGNAAGNSDLALGFEGPDAITAYIWDFGANNAEVGHRRWLLYPQTETMGTGDVPEQGSFEPANATWVFDANLDGPRPATRHPYVAWPPKGYVPYPLVYPQWSFALSNADLSAATVAMTSNGVSVAVALQPYETGYGENTLVWVPMGLDPTSLTLFPFAGTDTVYTVTITNILADGVPTGFSYSVIAFDPSVPGAGCLPPQVSGPTQPAINAANPYTFTCVSNAASYEWRDISRAPFSFSDGAESGLGNFTANASSGYSVIDSSVHASGLHSFHLAHPSPPTDQILRMNQCFTPGSNTVLTFESRLGYAGNAETALVQVSTNGGADWTSVYSQTGSGGAGELAFNQRSVPLDGYSGCPLQLRFDYSISSGSYYPQTSAGFGWYIDDILLTNAEIWTVLGTNAAAGANFTFMPAQTGCYSLQVQAILFGGFPLPWGPAFALTAVAGPPVILLNAPFLSNGVVDLDFSVSSGSASVFELLESDQIGAAWTTNQSAALTTNILGISYSFRTDLGPATRFYRVQTP